MAPNKENYLNNVFNVLVENEIEYIALRKHEFIPDKLSIENDLDLLMHRKVRGVIKKIFRRLGFSYYSDSKDDNTYLYASYPHDHFINKKQDLHFDVVYTLAHRSTNNGEWVSIHEDLQNDIWRNRLECEEIWKYRPSYLDEMLHIICHTILDKNTVSKYYGERMSSLMEVVDREELSSKLELVFFRFSPVIVNKIEERKFDALYEDYISFSDY